MITQVSICVLVRSRAWLVGSFVALAHLCAAQCVFLEGRIFDATTRKPLAANILTKIGGSRKILGQSTAQGVFAVQLPCEATVLLVEAKDFRPLAMPISGNTASPHFFFDLVLYAIDKQASDRPYFQSEQKDLVLNNANQKNEKTATRYFKLVDVQTKNALNGELCLFYTKTPKKKCADIKQPTKGERIVFDEEDIVGVVANAPNYQPYNGNLIIDQLDNRSSVYEIALSKLTTMLAFSIETTPFSRPPKVSIINKQGTSLAITLRDFTHGFVPNLNPDEVYTLKIATDKPHIEEKIRTVPGLNLVHLKIPPQLQNQPPTLPAAAPQPIANKNASAPTFRTIYFEQSHYVLLPAARQTLDSVANWLTQNPTINAQIMGFTDNVGDANLNRTLSEFRAKVAVNYLTTHGVAQTQLRWQALGGQYPAADNNKETAKALNRRVEIKILDEITNTLKY